MERMDNMVSHIKMQQFTFITIYINAAFVYDLEIISHLYNQVLFLVIAGKDGRDGVNGECAATTIECQHAFIPIQCCTLCGGQNYTGLRVI